MGWTSQVRRDKSKGAWYCRYSGRKTYLGKDYAEAVKRFARIIDGDDVRPILSVAGACGEWQRLHGNEWTRYLLERWTTYAGDTPIGDVDTRHLEHYAAWLDSRYSPETTRKCVRYVYRVCVMCADRGLLALPQRPKTRTPIRYPKDIAIDTLSDVLARVSTRRARRLLTFIAETGCRPKSARLLQWDQVDMSASVAVLTSHKTAKRTGRTQTIYLSQAAKDVLDDVPGDRIGYVFRSRLGKPYTKDGIRSILKRAGLGRVYALRHTYAQTMLDRGVAIEDVAKLLGHSNLATVQVYAQVRSQRLRDVVASQNALTQAPRPDGQHVDPHAKPAHPAKPKHSRHKPAKARGRRIA